MFEENIKSKSFCLHELFGEVSYEIDFYQREYTWGEDEVRTLVHDLCAAFDWWRQNPAMLQKPHRAPQYFLGPFVYYEQQRRRRFLVDGQQRFVTLHLLFMHLRAMVGGIYDDSADRLNRVIRRHDQSFCIGIKDHEPVLRAITEGRKYEPGIGDSLSRRNLWARSEQIVPLLNEALDNEQLPLFIDWLLDRVVLIGISAHSRDAGYRMFETMNDRGARLTPVDLLKSHLLSRVGAEEEKLNQQWQVMLSELTIDRDDRDAPSRFIKAVLHARYARLGNEEDRKSIDSNLNFWVRRNVEVVGLRTAGDYFRFVETLIELGRRYRPLLAAGNDLTHNFEPVYFNARNGITAQNVAMLAAMRPTDTLSEAKEKALRIARYLDRWYVLRVLEDLPVQPKDIREEVHDRLVPKLRGSTTSDDVTSRLGELVTDDATSILNFTKFSLRGNNAHHVRYLLARVTSFVETSCERANEILAYLDSDRYHIEHLWPKHHHLVSHDVSDPVVFRALRNQFGALGLLPGRDNSSLNDLPLGQKLGYYAKYNILLGVLSPGYRDRSPGLRDFKNSHGLEKLLRSFGDKDSMKKIIETRHELYLRLCEIIWNPVKLGIVKPDATISSEAASNKETLAPPAKKNSRARHRTRRGTDVALMVQAGILSEGTELFLRYKGREHSAVLDADGGIVIVATGMTYGKPDEAATAVRGTRCDAYREWQVKQSDGTHASLREIRAAAKTAGLFPRAGR
ncbi:GmrSD restriction endonuclease domain-containing protein [Nonomuraea sp. 3N208]|uniref:GmrSD restriction endonuclease domain-containing protein n=1 Tax=Nonomuraea sp. 3N208 TaxID=3457421 RepID=UPI003FD11A7E